MQADRRSGAKVRNVYRNPEQKRQPEIHQMAE
jgi:hypothetical protein